VLEERDKELENFEKTIVDMKEENEKKYIHLLTK